MSKDATRIKIVLENKIYIFFSLFLVFLAILLSYKFFRLKTKAEFSAYLYLEKRIEDLLNNISRPEAVNLLPAGLVNVSAGSKKSNLVRKVTPISISGIDNPYNASIIEAQSDKYLLFFRFDLPKPESIKETLLPFYSHIAVVELDEQFNQISDYKVIDTNSKSSEDPRVFSTQGRMFLLYNEIQKNYTYSRLMHICELDPYTFKTLKIQKLDPGLKFVEKNWMPFINKINNDSLGIHLIYSVLPYKIFALKEKTENFLIDNMSDAENLTPNLFWWEKKWGPICGGTPCQLVDGEFLAFFHSKFFDQKTKKVWYSFGAITFEAIPPYRITAISREPITFEGMYDTPHGMLANRSLRSIFPAGFIADSEQIHVSCGSNDSGILIVSLDKRRLLEGMIKIKKFSTEKYKLSIE